MLFTRNVSGPRIVTCKDEKKIGPLVFQRFGCSSSQFSEPYLALGMMSKFLSKFSLKFYRFDT